MAEGFQSGEVSGRAAFGYGKPVFCIAFQNCQTDNKCRVCLASNWVTELIQNQFHSFFKAKEPCLFKKRKIRKIESTCLQFVCMWKPHMRDPSSPIAVPLLLTVSSWGQRGDFYLEGSAQAFVPG